MAPLYGEMLQDGLITVNRVDLGEGYIEHRTVPEMRPELKLFSPDDLAYVESSIAYYWNLTGEEASDDSHGVAWRSRGDGDPMPYELALLSDAQPSEEQTQRRNSCSAHRKSLLVFGTVHSTCRRRQLRTPPFGP